MIWTEEQVAHLRALMADGLSSGQVAREFGPDLSRNAIVGKAARLGLKWRNAAFDSGGGIVNAIRGRQERVRKSLVRAREIPADAPKVIPAAPNSQPVDLLGLTNETCRWPINDESPFMFCGAPEADNAAGVVYCPFHAVAATNRRGGA